MATLLLASKQAKTPGILGADGKHIVSAVNHELVKIGALTFWHEGGVIHRLDEKTGQWGSVTPTQFEATLDLFKDIYQHHFQNGDDRDYRGMKLEMLGVKKKETVKQWYDDGMRLVRAAREHGAPEDPQGPERHRGRLPKWFRF